MVRRLYCEGTYQKWFHRWCAGVHKENYEALAAGDNPFLCPSCCLAEHCQLIMTLIDTMETLKDEICKLKEAAKVLPPPTIEKADSLSPSEELYPVTEPSDPSAPQAKDDEPWKKDTGKRKQGTKGGVGTKGRRVRANSSGNQKHRKPRWLDIKTLQQQRQVQDKAVRTAVENILLQLKQLLQRVALMPNSLLKKFQELGKSGAP